VTELHREAATRRQIPHERLDQPPVVVQRRRALEQDGAELVSEQLGELEERTHVLIGVGQSLEVGDPLVRLQGEGEAVRRLLAPGRERLLRREAAERVVDLDR
jgi:hypothetical protein